MGVLLGTDGRSALRCNLEDHHSKDILQANSSSQRLSLHGGQWRTLAVAGANSSNVWALGHDGLTRFSSGSSQGVLHDLLPTIDLQTPVAASLSAVTALGGHLLLGLESSGHLHVWPQQGGEHQLWRLSGKEARWHGLCADSTGIF